MSNLKQKITPTLIQSVLQFIKPFASKSLQNDIKALLQTCCKPVIEFGTDSCSSDNTATGVKFSGVTITDVSLAGKTATLILTSTEHGGGAIQTITFDSNGVWTGDIQTSWWNSGGTEIIQILLIAEGGRVAHVSEAQTVTGVNNCD